MRLCGRLVNVLVQTSNLLCQEPSHYNYVLLGPSELAGEASCSMYVQHQCCVEYESVLVFPNAKNDSNLLTVVPLSGRGSVELERPRPGNCNFALSDTSGITVI